MTKTARLALALPLLAPLSCGPLLAADAPVTAPKRFRLTAELKANVRSSSVESFKLSFPFPPDFIPPGQTAVFMRTVSPHTSAEISNVALTAEADLTPHIAALAKVHILDLYNRNPTSSEDRILLREAWLRFGVSSPTLEPIEGTSAYALVGKAPRFSKQIKRKLESYGLWGTAVGRFEEVQIELGGTLGKNVYWRGAAASPNPLFFRDPNALAGDNGTPERVPGNVHPIYESGFPILYDAKAQDLNSTGKLQVGGGLGFRLLDAAGENGVDVLAWYFRRDLADSAVLRGTSYSGDIKLLQAFSGFGISFALDGREKREFGVNVEARYGGLHVFGQYVDQSIAGLKRSGYEVEASYVIAIPSLFLSGETPLVNWIEPAVRVSSIDNDFVTNPLYPAPSVGWDWRKYDFGVRLGILKGVDVTAEYSRNDTILFSGAKLHPDEFLLTFRASLGM